MRKHRSMMDEESSGFSWRSIRSLVPYILEHKSRVALALFCLVLAKVASVGLPFILETISYPISFAPLRVLNQLPAKANLVSNGG